MYKKEHAESTEVDHEDTDFDDYEVSAIDPETKEETEVGQKKEASGLSYLPNSFETTSLHLHN